MSDWFTPAQIARQRHLRVGKVLAWIHRGELEAINCADNARGRPRWRVHAEALSAFDRVRSNRVSLVPHIPPRRRCRTSDLIEFF